MVLTFFMHSAEVDHLLYALIKSSVISTHHANSPDYCLWLYFSCNDILGRREGKVSVWREFTYQSSITVGAFDWDGLIIWDLGEME